MTPTRAALPVASAFGVDIGGSGIKGAPVDLATGRLAKGRERIATPQPATPAAVAATVAELLGRFEVPPGTPVGVTFPAIVHHGVARSAAHADSSWLDTSIEDVGGSAPDRPVRAGNEAGAPAHAPVRFRPA